MNSLLNYGTDDTDDSGEDNYRDSLGGPSRNSRKPTQGQDDVNYEEVGMDMSEDSDKEQPPTTKKKEQQRRDEKKGRERERVDTPKRDERRKDDRAERRGEGHGREKDDRRDRHDRDEKRDRERDDDRRDRRRDDRSSRDDRHGRDKDRKDRERRRSRSRDRDRRRSKSPRRSRSKSKEKAAPRAFASRRIEKANIKMDRLDKMGIDLKTNEPTHSATDEKNDQQTSSNDRFFMPGITGRFRDQIERRKMLWQKGSQQPQQQQPARGVQHAAVGINRSAKVWQNTSFGDDKTSNKFKRLMGMKVDGDDSSSAGKPATEVLKKQEQMFNSMEAQYEVARAATHTMRGVGLGFGSFQR